MAGEDNVGWHVVRFTLTALSPLSCGAGEGAKADNQIARDANGLPMIPGATLQGLLRHAYEGDDRDDLFGFASPQDKSSSDAGRILCANGAVHGTDNVAVTADAAIESDELLLRLSDAVPLKREHVGLDHRHGADPARKYNRASVPKGTRFSFEWLMFGKKGEALKLARALAPLSAAWFRIGSAGARGYGRVQLEAAAHGFFGLADADALRAVRQSSLSSTTGLETLAIAASQQKTLTIELSLVSINPWRSGQDGVRLLGEIDGNGEAGLAATREPEIRWHAGKGQWLEPQSAAADRDLYILPGSSLRGPLAHRTLFHWNRQSEQMIDADADFASKLAEYSERQEPLQALFGFARDGTGGDEGGQASVILFEDVALPVEAVIPVNHVKIDRFTGGALPSALYSEELIETATLRTRIHVRTARWELDQTARDAFLDALCDLCNGRLAVGAKSYGYFTDGKISFSGADAQVWQERWNQRIEAGQ